uniref:EGF-like domain-containing protein n=1 Tax=Periophthalmus magnuspinnatus TaxID=409849 RepID=A0A3B4A030_9GOBI
RRLPLSVADIRPRPAEIQSGTWHPRPSVRWPSGPQRESLAQGEACGFKVCQNQGQCRPISTDSFMCVCPPAWTGSVCNQSVGCVNNNCKQGSFCSPYNVTSYSCLCPLGWTGRFCDTEISTDTFRFMGKSYIKYIDSRYNTRDLKNTKVSFSFLSSSNDSLVMWMGKAEHDDEDYLAIGLEKGQIKIAVNLGERLPKPLSFKNTTLYSVALELRSWDSAVDKPAVANG